MGPTAVTPDQFSTFGELLRHLRRQARLTQRELAIAVGYSDTQISRIEQNLRVPDAATITGLFVPALCIEEEPKWVARLLELANAAQAESHEPRHPPPFLEWQAESLETEETTFVARATELAWRSEHLKLALAGQGRMIFVTGEAGSGKTALFREFARQAHLEAEELLMTNGYCNAPATGGFVPPGMLGYSKGIGLEYDPHQARLLLTAAGFPNGQGFPLVEALKPPGYGSEIICEYLLVHWRKILGVEIAWEQMDWGKTRLAADPPTMFLIGWVADYPDPDNFLRVARESGGWLQAPFGELVNKARRVLDQEDRLGLYRRADHMLVEEATVIPLLYGQLHRVVKPWVSKFPASAIDRWFWKDFIINSH